MGKQMMQKRSKIDIAMLVISTVLITWLSVMEQIRNTFIETGEAFISKKTMFWLDIFSIMISALLTIFSGVKVGKTEKAIKRSREAKNDEKLKSKPLPVLEKIVDGKVHKTFQEMTLSEQPFLMDDSKTIAQVLTEKNNRVLRFIRYQVGEGIEKRKDDFASEVMKEIGK